MTQVVIHRYTIHVSNVLTVIDNVYIINNYYVLRTCINHYYFLMYTHHSQSNHTHLMYTHQLSAFTMYMQYMYLVNVYTSCYGR